MPTQPAQAGCRPGVPAGRVRRPRSNGAPWCGMARRSVAGARRAVDGAVRVEHVWAWSPFGMRCTGPPATNDQPPGIGPTGTPRRPKRPTPWPSRSAVSSSPPDFAVLALTGSRRRKPGPFRQTGLAAEHDQRSCEIRWGSASGPILGWLICEYEIRGLKPQVSHARWW